MLRLGSELCVVQRLHSLLTRHTDRLLGSTAYMGIKARDYCRIDVITASPKAKA
jgi:hypothetical protein